MARIIGIYASPLHGVRKELKSNTSAEPVGLDMCGVDLSRRGTNRSGIIDAIRTQRCKHVKSVCTGHE